MAEMGSLTEFIRRAWRWLNKPVPADHPWPYEHPDDLGHWRMP